MTVAHAHDHLHHLVDRLPAAQARRLLRLVRRDPELAAYADDAADTDLSDEAVDRPRLASAAIFDSGRGDLSERVDELVAERFNHPV